VAVARIAPDTISILNMNTNLIGVSWLAYKLSIQMIRCFPQHLHANAGAVQFSYYELFAQNA